MWIIALILLQGTTFQIASDQMLYRSLYDCEQARAELVARLDATKPNGGKIISSCVQMTDGLGV